MTRATRVVCRTWQQLTEEDTIPITNPRVRARKRPYALITGFSYGRADPDLIERVREARQRLGSTIVNIDGRPRFIDPAEIVEREHEDA